MKTLDFIKMHSLGNDFVIFDQLKKSFKFSKSQIKKISDRNFGIGCDQILILKKSNIIQINLMMEHELDKRRLFFKENLYKMFNSFVP